MSIPNIIHKIKGKMDLDRFTILYLFIIVGVGISSFGLGRISVGSNLKNEVLENTSISQKGDYPTNINPISREDSITQSILPKEKKYVASKNGKMYYGLGCSGAKRIKQANEVWFSTKEDAEKSGFTLSTTCK